jgi:predicted Zn-dependent protease
MKEFSLLLFLSVIVLSCCGKSRIVFEPSEDSKSSNLVQLKLDTEEDFNKLEEKISLHDAISLYAGMLKIDPENHLLVSRLAHAMLKTGSPEDADMAGKLLEKLKQKSE